MPTPAAVNRIGEVISVQVIARPHEELSGVLTYQKPAVPVTTGKTTKNDGA